MPNYFSLIFSCLLRHHSLIVPPSRHYNHPLTCLSSPLVLLGQSYEDVVVYQYTEGYEILQVKNIDAFVEKIEQYSLF